MRREVSALQLASPFSRLGASLLNVLLCVLTLVIGYLVWTLVLWEHGTNPGKKMLGLHVVDAKTGLSATWGHMFVRNFLVGFFLLGLLGTVTLYVVTIIDALFIFRADRRRLVDLISSTQVVRG